MNKQEQDKLWSELSEETKQEYLEKYRFHLTDSKKEMKCNDGGYDLTVLRSNTIVDELVNMFGNHNLNPEPPTPKTWEDVEEYYTQIDIELDKATKSLCNYSHCSIQLLQKCIATLKIAKLIELGYGGMVSEEECDNILPLWIIRCDYKGKVFVESYKGVVIDKLLTFRTRELAEEFMSHESNRQLVQQYYLM